MLSLKIGLLPSKEDNLNGFMMMKNLEDFNVNRTMKINAVYDFKLSYCQIGLKRVAEILGLKNIFAKKNHKCLNGDQKQVRSVCEDDPNFLDRIVILDEYNNEEVLF